MNAQPDVSSHGARILIVDDERNDRTLLELLLAPLGYDVVTAASGEQALAMVAVRPPDLILLDVLLPGMSGPEVAEALKREPSTKHIPIIMVTALDDRHARMLGLRAGAEEFLSKPVDRAELSVRVRNLLRLKAYGDQHDAYSRLLEGEVGSRTADLIASERLYRTAFDAAPVGIVHIGLDGQWLQVNQRLSDLLGYTREELSVLNVSPLVRVQDLGIDAAALREMASGGSDRHVIDERLYRHRDGSAIWARVNISIHRDADGVAVHFIAVIEDITERRMLEAQLRQTNKMDAVGRLASGVAHDFNNLITVILGFTELVTSDPVAREAHGQELGEIGKAARRAAGLTRQLLAFSRQQVLYAETIDVNSLIADMAGMLARLIGDDIAITSDLAPDLYSAQVDRGQLEQVVMNLVVNARDAMVGGGLVSIETRNVTIDHTFQTDDPVVPGDYVRLTIADTGTGMTTATLRNVFEPFFTTKEAGQGTGLGLSTTYGIIKQSKGYIAATSKIGKGSTFTVYLPCAQYEPPALTVTIPVPAPPSRPGETILLVEDEPALRKLAARILNNAGYRVIEATNGGEAEVLFSRYADAIELVVTDVNMPGCSGPELYRRLQIRAPNLRVLYMSGYAEQSDVKLMDIDQRRPFVQKPFTASEFTTHVREVLDRRVIAQDASHARSGRAAVPNAVVKLVRDNGVGDDDPRPAGNTVA